MVEEDLEELAPGLGEKAEKTDVETIRQFSAFALQFARVAEQSVSFAAQFSAFSEDVSASAPEFSAFVSDFSASADGVSAFLRWCLLLLSDSAENIFGVSTYVVGFSAKPAGFSAYSWIVSTSAGPLGVQAAQTSAAPC